jgi:peptidoglycan hydrolase CwlO-like protein
MEPIITLTYIVTSFFGYFVGADIWNQTKFTNELNKVKSKLDSISSNLNKLDNTISSQLNRIDSKLD